eukprot:gnl/MRDRNA2_/MRDRNA2_83767_c0_seq2.p1 gnl/MRDRNA2_/MRDRNA2_83767_c0~~gnl/MRDRNA2_/MRDRNA2_83767_c0_seq2.p1  ORF type:complete len:253 (+),score=63.53 gnl/MRDRNA2_/MRDRNA2_83767_c0_seq2:30-761(+)
MEAVVAMFCPIKATLKCVAAEPLCKDDPDDTSMGAIACICECPGLMLMYEENNEDKVCADQRQMDCMFTVDSCKKSMEIDGSPDNLKKSLAVSCESHKLGCGDSDLKDLKDGDKDEMIKKGCDDKMFDDFNEKGCKDNPTEACCPVAKKLLGCVGKECTQLKMAAAKLSVDNGGGDADKNAEELKFHFKLAKACPDLGLPSNDAEVAANIPDVESVKASTASGCTCRTALMFAAAVALYAVGA